MIHDSFVYSLDCGKETFFSSSKDKKIYQLDFQGNPVSFFEGHQNTINCVWILDETHIISGSWDGTAKIWNISTQECVTTLGGHSHAVTVLVLQNGQIITGSQDGKIWRWNRDGKQTWVWDGHKDIIRDFAEIPGLGFVSVSNDELGHVWSYDGDMLYSLIGHSGFIFCVKVLMSNKVATGSDDRTVKIWESQTCI